MYQPSCAIKLIPLISLTFTIAKNVSMPYRHMQLNQVIFSREDSASAYDDQIWTYRGMGGEYPLSVLSVLALGWTCKIPHFSGVSLRSNQ
jgi:hypothetical protein